jgi:uncharacterized protein YwqG
MSFLKKLLGAFSPKSAGAQEPRADRVPGIVASIEAAAQPCLRLVGREGGRSCLGGAPHIAGAWPRFEGRPLSVVAQLDLAEIAAAGGPDWLPRKGRLLFFYELDYSGWGMGPSDLGCFAVRHETGSATPEPPPEDLADEGRWPEYPVAFGVAVSTPDSERLNLPWSDLTKREEKALEAALEAMTPAEPVHQIGGFPGTIQADAMELECELVAFGLQRGAGVKPDATQMEQLKVASKDWRLLLQLDTDNDAGMMWGDTGRLYFWIREQDARAGDFSKAWMILQCY